MNTVSMVFLSLYLSTNLNCPTTVVDNRTSTWTKLDHDNLMVAKKRCKHHYKNSPCLKLFIKKEEAVYNAICGAEEKRGKKQK